MKRAVMVALFSLLAIPQAVLAQNLDWHSYSPSNFDFSVLVLGDPTVGQPEIDKGQDGTVRSTTSLFTFNSNGIFGAVGISEYNFTFDPAGDLKAEQDNFLKSAHATLLYSQAAEFLNGNQKLPELLFDFDGGEQSRRGRCMVVIKGNRAYMLLFMFEKGQDYTAEMGRFFGSFTFTSATK